MSLVRLAVAGAAVTAALAVPAAPAVADPVWPPPPTHIGMCTLWWRAVPIFSDDVPVTPYVPYCVW